MNRLRELRKQHGLTQDELGQALGVQKAAICKYETGRVPLPNDALMQLCSIFHVTADYILGRDTVTTMFKERGSSSALFMPVTDTVGVPLVGRVHAGLPILRTRTSPNTFPCPQATSPRGITFIWKWKGTA